MNKEKITFIIVGVVFVVGLILTLVFGGGFTSNVPEKTLVLPERNDTAPEVPLLENYGTKVVYTTDTTVPKDVYINDCSARGGVFDTCGNTCAPDAASCATVCALTCTIK